MVTPTPACEQFCDFILLEIGKRLTVGRKALVQDIKTAAHNATTVSDDDWNNFTLTAIDFYNPYLIYSSFKI